MVKVLTGAALVLLALGVPGTGRAAGLSAERVNGTYSLEKDATRGGVVVVRMSSKGTLDIHIEVSNLYGRYNSGVAGGSAPLVGNEATFTPENVDPACKIKLSFAPANTVLVSQEGGSGECGLGNAVTTDGYYVKVRGGRLPFGQQFNNDPAAAEPKGLSQLSSDAAAEAQAASGSISSKLPRITELAAKRKSLQTTLAASKKDYDAHTRAGAAAASKRLTALGKANANPSASALSSTAQSEYNAAKASGRTAVKTAAQLRAVEDELAQLAAEANQASVDAQLGLADVRKSLSKLSALATKARAEAKKLAGQAKPADAAASATALEARAKADSEAASRAAKEASSAARVALAKAAINPKGYDAVRAKAATEGKALVLSLSKVDQALRALQAPPKPAAPKQCDLRKMDWAKYYPSTSEQTEDGTNEFGVGDVSYPDLDGDGIVEALVTKVYSRLGATASQSFEWTILGRDRDCVVSELVTLHGQMCSSLEVKGRIVVFDNLCGEDQAIVEYQLAAGKLKETKRRAQ